MAASRRTLVRENGDVRITAVIIDRLEAGFGDDDETWLWDVQGWSGGDINRFWWKSEGEGDFGGGTGEVQRNILAAAGADIIPTQRALPAKLIDKTKPVVAALFMAERPLPRQILPAILLLPLQAEHVA